MTEPRNVTAICQFRGGPGREREAALAWAFELTYYFLRGVGEAPVVTYADGIYTCTGLMTTTHPFDRDPTEFDKGSPWDLDYNTNPERMKSLRELYDQSGPRWDGRAVTPVCRHSQ
jgi:hypothetical protein